MDKNPTTATVKTPASNFTGDVWMNPVFSGDSRSRLTVGLVRFTPGARTNWHVHPNGQTLHVLEGIALVGTRDGTIVAARPGETVSCDPGLDHWHGATAETLAVHIAIVTAGAEHDGTDWLEPVADDDYAAANA